MPGRTCGGVLSAGRRVALGALGGLTSGATTPSRRTRRRGVFRSKRRGIIARRARGDGPFSGLEGLVRSRPRSESAPALVPEGGSKHVTRTKGGSGSGAATRTPPRPSGPTDYIVGRVSSSPLAGTRRGPTPSLSQVRFRQVRGPVLPTPSVPLGAGRCVLVVVGPAGRPVSIPTLLLCFVITFRGALCIGVTRPSRPSCRTVADVS